LFLWKTNDRGLDKRKKHPQTGEQRGENNETNSRISYQKSREEERQKKVK